MTDFETRFRDPQPSTTKNVVLYGPAGSGKTTGACSAPCPVLYLGAEGLNAVDFAKTIYKDINVVEVDGRAVLEDAYLWLRDKKLARTVVLDSASEIRSAVLRDIAKDPRHPTLPEQGDASTFVERYLMSLRDLPVNVVVVAHEFSVKDEASGAIERAVYAGTNNPALSNKIMGVFADVVGYCARVEQETGDDVYMAQLVDGNGRRGKNRGGVLGKAAEIDVAAWIELMVPSSNGTAKTTQKEQSK